MSMVRTLIDPGRQQKDWDEQLPFAMLAYRSSIQESTGETPAMMMLGRELSLPVDVMIPPQQSVDERNKDTDYAEELRNRLHDVHDRARNKLKLSGVKQTRTYDRNTELNKHNVGDWVWLSDLQRKKGVCPKLVFKWEGPYLVTHRLSDVVYRIQKSEKAKPKVVHYDRLKAYNGEAPRNWLNSRRTNPNRNRRIPQRYLE
ncbi:uncharacterized protein LOC121422329 [Lytechinus variegatus]|uniref:uncharacterized protein LOC121422329 n=1 Tax=Lytechinus variegatus TaxID=7654 RepID=UPI001BB22A40|nr:uncharacterized protein LOC121422329 [Lytechinus variegatus]